MQESYHQQWGLVGPMGVYEGGVCLGLVGSLALRLGSYGVWDSTLKLWAHEQVQYSPKPAVHLDLGTRQAREHEQSPNKKDE